MPETQSELDEVRIRLARLEAATSRPRGRTNLPGAARYLGISEETLRRKHLRGEGPPRMKVCSRVNQPAEDFGICNSTFHRSLPCLH
jgi:hypothetical protein